MSDYVELRLRKNRGWPWPESSWGLDSMYGVDGWCHSCGTPIATQTGPMVVQNKGKDITGAWVPNWHFDAFCASAQMLLAAPVELRNETRPIQWRGLTAATPAVQIVNFVSARDWADADELREVTIRRHGSAGQTCESCGSWRWNPILPSDIPSIVLGAETAEFDVIASPEWFGSGWQSFRQVIFRSEFGRALHELSPRDFDVIDLDNVTVER